MVGTDAGLEAGVEAGVEAGAEAAVAGIVGFKEVSGQKFIQDRWSLGRPDQIIRLAGPRSRKQRL